MEQLEFQSTIIELFRELKSDMHRRFDEVDKRFEQVDKRFEQVDKRFERMEKQLDHHEVLLSDHGKQLEAIRAQHNKVKITFGWQWGLASFVIAITAASMARIVL